VTSASSIALSDRYGGHNEKRLAAGVCFMKQVRLDRGFGRNVPLAAHSATAMDTNTMNDRSPLIVGIGGTMRAGSTSEQALRLALTSARAAGAETQMFSGGDLLLPMYGVLASAANEASTRMIAALRRADGVIIASPVYHGGVSGLIKNAIDYVEEMRSDPRVYLDRRAVGAIACGYGNQGAAMVLAQLRQMTHALRGWPTPLGVAINSAIVNFHNGQCSDRAVAAQIEIMAQQVVEFASAQALISLVGSATPQALNGEYAAPT
jgi:FMN reductase